MSNKFILVLIASLFFSWDAGINSTQIATAASIDVINDVKAKSAPSFSQHPSSLSRNLPANTIISGSAVANILSEGFESGVIPPSNWFLEQSNLNASWSINTVGPHSGSYFADVIYDPALLDQDEVLLTMELIMDTAILSFYSKGNLYWCRDTFDNCDLEVWLVPGEWDGGTGDDIYVGKADDDWSATWEWALSSFDLITLLPLNKPVRIGFRYTGNDGAQIGLDNIEIRYTQRGFPWLVLMPGLVSPNKILEGRP